VLTGLLLAGVATLLTWESRGLRIGEGIRPQTAQTIRDLVLAQPGVRDVGRVLSMYVGPNDVLVTMDLDFDAETDAAEAAPAIGKVEQQVREHFPVARRLFIESGSAPVQQRCSRPNAVRLPAEAPVGLGPAPAAGSLTSPGADATRCASAQTPTPVARIIKRSIADACSAMLSVPPVHRTPARGPKGRRPHSQSPPHEHPDGADLA